MLSLSALQVEAGKRGQGAAFRLSASHLSPHLQGLGNVLGTSFQPLLALGCRGSWSVPATVRPTTRMVEVQVDVLSTVLVVSFQHVHLSRFSVFVRLERNESNRFIPSGGGLILFQQFLGGGG